MFRYSANNAESELVNAFSPSHDDASNPLFANRELNSSIVRPALFACSANFSSVTPDTVTAFFSP